MQSYRIRTQIFFSKRQLPFFLPTLRPISFRHHAVSTFMIRPIAAACASGCRDQYFHPCGMRYNVGFGRVVLSSQQFVSRTSITDHRGERNGLFVQAVCGLLTHWLPPVLTTRRSIACFRRRKGSSWLLALIGTNTNDGCCCTWLDTTRYLPRFGSRVKS